MFSFFTGFCISGALVSNSFKKQSYISHYFLEISKKVFLSPHTFLSFLTWIRLEFLHSPLLSFLFFVLWWFSLISSIQWSSMTVMLHQVQLTFTHKVLPIHRILLFFCPLPPPAARTWCCQCPQSSFKHFASSFLRFSFSLCSGAQMSAKDTQSKINRTQCL